MNLKIQICRDDADCIIATLDLMFSDREIQHGCWSSLLARKSGFEYVLLHSNILYIQQVHLYMACRKLKEIHGMRFGW